MKVQTIAVYCGSSNGNNKAFIDSAKKLGSWIGKSGLTLVYGGGDSGLMGIVAKAAKENGAPVIGVVPEDVEFIRTRPQPYCTKVEYTENMSARKQKMLELADAFVALPGGIGTIDEISEAITLTKINVFNKKSVLINADGYYDSFKSMFEKMNDSEFLNSQELSHVLFSDDIDEIQAFLLK